MKKTLILIAALVGVVASSYGQGEVFYNNTATASTKIWTNSTPSTGQNTVGGGLMAANSVQAFTFALFVAPSTVSSVSGLVWNDPNWTFSTDYATNTILGRLAASAPLADGGVAMPNGFAVGSTASLLVIGWNTSIGGSTLSSFETAYGDGAAGLLYGASGVGSILLGNGSTPPNSTVFGTGVGQLTGFTLAPIPEPTVFAISGLSAAAMLIFRRRK